MPPSPEPVGPGDESVWDYPRPPRLEPSSVDIEVVLGGEVIARTHAAWRVLETSHPPVYYLPPSAFEPGSIAPAEGESWCEWKGVAKYWTLRGGGVEAVKAAWSVEQPTRQFTAIRGYVAVYAGRVDECRIDGEVVIPQPGEFYGGWITAKIKGPFKGLPSTMGW